MDYYKTLGLRRDASKEEIKEAFRRSALRFHPDRHSNASEEVKDAASVRFKQASEAYEVLIDERMRADYDRAWRGAGSFDRRGYGGYSSSSSSSSSSHYYGGNQYGYGYGYGGGGGGYRRPPGSGSGGLGFDMEFVFRVLTRRGFLINVGFASALLGGAVIIEECLQAMWRMNNSGKSFEEAMESIEKVKVQKKDG
ncbi:chaperone protein dnaJ 72 isoform X1 [Ananas comosus]|uniref:Chaperone protein dnaJ 72 isoform X1 n=1 Tax=Ananas comosus TaxID=4615 RepID=A0A6P5EPQ9_ANACO|nr:chaperone protein dnaJ 72 isoform X1 [Ananas comosus]